MTAARPGRALTAALLAALLLTPAALTSPALAVDDAAIRDAARRVLADPRYDKRLPDEIRPAPRADASPRRVYRGPRSATPRDPVSSGSSVSQVLLYTLLVVGGVALIALIARELARARDRRRATITATVATPETAETAAILAAMPATLANAHALARAGKLDEAVHLLLRGAIDDVARLTGVPPAPALTSRELLAQTPLEPPSRGAFEQLVSSVEVSLFGGLPVTPGDFARCADAFSHLHGRLLAR